MSARSLHTRRACAAALALCACSLAVRPALGFCRTTTCDASKDAQRCLPDAHKCPTKGTYLSWPDVCVTFAVQQIGSKRRGITAYETDAASRRAFTAWISADCGGGLVPSIGIIPLGGVECSRVEFNPPDQGKAGAPNANIIMFRDDTWPYADEQSTIAKTTLTFDTQTGDIFDADIEINSFGVEISLGDTAVSHDLEAILTHEFGHFLGLAHSDDPSATMFENYSPQDLGFRTLSPDDQAAICEVYPPVGESEVSCPPSSGPHHGFARECGGSEWADASCLSLARPARGSAGAGGIALVTLAALARRRARRASA